MKHIILTGMPGAGKTTLIDALSTAGFLTVPEAATDIITEAQAHGVRAPWLSSDFFGGCLVLANQAPSSHGGGAGSGVFL